MFENTEDLTFDITSFGSQPDIEEEKEVPAAQSEVFYVEQFSLLQNPEHALEMTQNFESLNIGLGKRPAEAEAEANPIVEESSAKR